jgi:penicillin-binding protein 1A
MKKVWADKSLGVSPDDKFVKPSEWKDGCSNLKGLGSGYGDDGGLQTLDEIKNPKPVEPSGPKTPGKKEENVNENLNTSEDIDFNNK